MNKKQKLGQFFTTNYEYILKNIKIPENISEIVEPFAGNKDLIKYLGTYKKDFLYDLYDIDPKHNDIKKQDTILNPPDMSNKFILTNPPYLAKNKTGKEYIEYFKKYNDVNDLYKCFIKILIKQTVCGGILIIPLNFFCSVRKMDINLRKDFMNKYDIIKLNIFKEKIFEDTSYSICSFLFILNNNNVLKDIDTYIYPDNKNITMKISKKNYLFGGEIYDLKLNKNIKIDRATKKNYETEYITNIKIQCIDNSIDNKIKLFYDEKYHIDTTEKLSERSYATLIINKKLTNEEQKKIINNFNEYFNDLRDKYDSLFLTTFREGKNNFIRKRITFKLAYNIINYIMSSATPNK